MIVDISAIHCDPCDEPQALSDCGGNDPPSQRERYLSRLRKRAVGIGPKLTFGNCFAYALARKSGEPLLFVGDGFVQTDIAAVLSAGQHISRKN